MLTAPNAHGALSVFDSTSARQLARRDGRLVAAATLVDVSSGQERSLFARDERCGDALSLVTPGPSDPASSFVKLALRPQAESQFSFHVSLDARQQPSAVFSKLAGVVQASEGSDWKVTFAAAGGADRKPRPLDAAPVEHALSPPLPAGQVRAGFWIDTGRDLHDGPGMESGLVVIVRYAEREYRQTIASCAEAGRGSALGDVTATVLDTAACGALYRVVFADAAVSVEREAADGSRSIVTRIAVPKGARATDLEASAASMRSLSCIAGMVPVRMVASSSFERVRGNQLVVELEVALGVDFAPRAAHGGYGDLPAML
ncbi:MAG TPA: hypothetical protein VFN67_22120 [Polyangiales bacterium]|nr:hypothetical protein [Polyangiales bacterium]